MSHRQPSTLYFRRPRQVLMVASLAACLPLAGRASAQFAGTFRLPGLDVDVYRVLGPACAPRATPPHPKWFLTTELRGQYREPPRPMWMAEAVREEREYAPTTGKLRAVCLLVDFIDVPATKPLSHFADTLFGHTSPTDDGTMTDYFTEVSYGKLEVDGDVAPGTGGAMDGWFRAPHDLHWYAAGQRGNGSYPRNTQGLAEDVIRLADPVVDFSRYASGGPESTVDLLFIVHAGTSSQYSNQDTDLQTHVSPTHQDVSVDGVKCRSYALLADDDTMGSFAHEAGHLFGADDLYDNDWTTGQTSEAKWDDNDYPVSEWCLMALGCYCGGGSKWNGSCPAHPCGYAKWAYFRWLGDPTVIAPEDHGREFEIRALESDNGPQAQYCVCLKDKEWFFIENRLPGAGATRFDLDTLMPDATGSTSRRGGLVVYHVDEREPTGGGWLNDGWPNNDHYGVWVEDPGMTAREDAPATWTVSPPGQMKALAALRSDGVAAIRYSNSRNGPMKDPYKLYPTTRDNSHSQSAVREIRALTPPGEVMRFRVRFRQ